MCKVGDIIHVNNYLSQGNVINAHSFIVVSDKNGTIEGLDFTMIANVMSSIRNPIQRERKLSYPGNFPIANEDTITNPDNGRDAYVKCDQLYFFNKDRLEYSTIGVVNSDIMDLILEFINEGNFDIEVITENL